MRDICGSTRIRRGIFESAADLERHHHLHSRAQQDRKALPLDHTSRRHPHDTRQITFTFQNESVTRRRINSSRSNECQRGRRTIWKKYLRSSGRLGLNLGARSFSRWARLSPSPAPGTLLCWVDATLHKVPCWQAEFRLACRMGWRRGICPLPAAAVPFPETWVYPADFSTATANERSAAQMDQPSPRDSITITKNAAPAASCGPIPCAGRWGSSNIQSVR